MIDRQTAAVSKLCDIYADYFTAAQVNGEENNQIMYGILSLALKPTVNQKYSQGEGRIKTLKIRKQKKAFP